MRRGASVADFCAGTERAALGGFTGAGVVSTASTGSCGALDAPSGVAGAGATVCAGAGGARWIATKPTGDDVSGGVGE
jgi:hypothetical protein